MSPGSGRPDRVLTAEGRPRDQNGRRNGRAEGQVRRAQRIPAPSRPGSVSQVRPALGQSSAGRDHAALLLTCKSVAAASCWLPSGPCGAARQPPCLSGCSPNGPFLEKASGGPRRLLCSLSRPQARQPHSVQGQAWGGQGPFGVTATSPRPLHLQRPRPGRSLVTEILVKGMPWVLNSCLRGWFSARLGELTGLLQYCRFIFRPHSPPLVASLGSQLLITCARAA